METPKCPRCSAELKKIEGKEYYACPNWKPQNKGCEGTIYWPEGIKKKSYPNVIISYKVESKSNPGHYHQVKVYESGDVYCPCFAGDMGKFCSHKKIMIKEVANKINQIIIKYGKK